MDENTEFIMSRDKIEFVWIGPKTSMYTRDFSSHSLPIIYQFAKSKVENHSDCPDNCSMSTECKNIKMVEDYYINVGWGV